MIISRILAFAHTSFSCNLAMLVMEVHLLGAHANLLVIPGLYFLESFTPPISMSYSTPPI